MSALTCPVCAGSMREVSKNGVTIDTCTQCRGVWLDRGELDKLLGDMRSGSYHDDDDRDDHRRPPQHQERRDYDDDDHRYRGDSHGYPRKKRSKMESFMDIFD